MNVIAAIELDQLAKALSLPSASTIADSRKNVHRPSRRNDRGLSRNTPSMRIVEIKVSDLTVLLLEV
jgi:hypothetical protein